jgi:hypothetical protein
MPKRNGSVELAGDFLARPNAMSAITDWVDGSIRQAMREGYVTVHIDELVEGPAPSLDTEPYLGLEIVLNAARLLQRQGLLTELAPRADVDFGCTDSIWARPLLPNEQKTRTPLTLYLHKRTLDQGIRYEAIYQDPSGCEIREYEGLTVVQYFLSTGAISKSASIREYAHALVAKAYPAELVQR